MTRVSARMGEETVIWATISDFKPAADRDAIHEGCRFFMVQYHHSDPLAFLIPTTCSERRNRVDKEKGAVFTSCIKTCVSEHIHCVPRGVLSSQHPVCRGPNVTAKPKASCASGQEMQQETATRCQTSEKSEPCHWLPRLQDHHVVRRTQPHRCRFI